MVRGGDRTRRRESEVLWPAGSVFQLWFIRTTNTSAVCRPASATSREPTACGRKPRTSGVHAEQGEGDLRGALRLCRGFSPLPKGTVQPRLSAPYRGGAGACTLNSSHVRDGSSVSSSLPLPVWFPKCTVDTGWPVKSSSLLKKTFWLDHREGWVHVKGSSALSY